MATVCIRAVRKSFGAFDAIRGASIDIDDGEFVVLVGPSGCGKSTLLRMLAGLESISGGDIVIGSRIVNDLPPMERDIAMVFQNYALYPHMTVAQNMGFSLKLQRQSKAVIAERVRATAEILSLAPLLDRFPRQLSGGQRQRVAMGRAIVRDPAVFLFDEPLSNLDAKLRVQMRAEIKELHQRLGTTIVYVTHDQVEAMTMADKMVVMNRGQVEQVGTPLDLFDRPANRFVAEFVGSPAMNFMAGKLAADDRVVLDSLPGVWLHAPALKVPPKTIDVLYGIRPEHIELAEDGLPATVSVVEQMGSEVQIVARVGDTRVTVRCTERRSFSVGQPIFLRPQQRHAHLFDVQSGLRLV